MTAAPLHSALPVADIERFFASAAASSPDQTSGHLGRQLSAQRRLLGGGSIQDAVMGDGNVNPFSSGTVDRGIPPHPRLSAEALDEAFAFIQPDEYRRIQQFSADRPLVVLTGETGSGRMATAVHLLCSGTGRQSIHVLRSDTDFAMPASAPLPDGSGIVLPDITATAAASLDAFRLRRLVDALSTAGQKMIVTASDSLTWGCPQIARHCVPLGPRPAPDAVVRAHFRRHFSASAQDLAQSLLNRDDVARLVAAHTGPDQPLRKASLLADLLADAAGEPDSMAATAATGMALADAGEIGRWFEALADHWPQDQYYAIALAVLDGLASDNVAFAAGRLERLLTPEGARADGEHRMREFVPGSSATLRHVHATQVPDERAETPDEHRTRFVRYINHDVPRRLLAHVWTQHDEKRGMLTQWLRELGAEPFEDIRLGAGVAAGVLAMSSYDHVFEMMLSPWALSGDPGQQDTAAVALQTLGADARFTERVHSLLGEWSQPGIPVSLQATAARAYGARFGEAHLDTSIATLTRLAEAAAWPVARAVTRSLAELIAVDHDEAAARVLAVLGEWAGGCSRYLGAVGRLAFLFAAADLGSPPAPGAVDGWPLLLRMDQDPYRTAVLRHLWVKALISSDVHPTARRVLSAWAGTVEHDPAGRDALARLLAGVAGTERTRAVVRRLAEDWAGPDGGGAAPLTAAALGFV